MVNGRKLNISPNLFNLLEKTKDKTGLSLFSVSEVLAIHIKTKQIEIKVPRKNQKVTIKQNDKKGLIDMF